MTGRKNVFRMAAGLTLMTAATGMYAGTPTADGINGSSSDLARWLTPVESRVMIYGGFDIPMADFADHTSVSLESGNEGYGYYGVMGGLQYQARLGSSGLGWVLDVNAIFNALDVDEFEQTFRTEHNLNDANWSIEVKPKMWWLTVPIQTGLRWQFEPVTDVAIHAAGLLGGAIVKPPDVDIEGHYPNLNINGTAEYKYETAGAFVATLEAGLAFNSVSILVRYLTGSSYESDADVRGTGTVYGWSGSWLQAHSFYKEFTLSRFTLMAGYTF